MKEEKKIKKQWLWFALAGWLLKDGKKIRDNAARQWLEKHNPSHPLLKSLSPTSKNY